MAFEQINEKLRVPENTTTHNNWLISRPSTDRLMIPKILNADPVGPW